MLLWRLRRPAPRLLRHHHDSDASAAAPHDDHPRRSARRAAHLRPEPTSELLAEQHQVLLRVLRGCRGGHPWARERRRLRALRRCDGAHGGRAARGELQGPPREVLPGRRVGAREPRAGQCVYVRTSVDAVLWCVLCCTCVLVGEMLMLMFCCWIGIVHGELRSYWRARDRGCARAGIIPKRTA